MACVKSNLHVDFNEAGFGVRLQLPDQIHISGDCRSRHEEASAGNRVPVQNNGLRSAGHLNRAAGIRRVGDVGRIRGGAERLLALNEFNRRSSLETFRSMVANGTGITILSDMVYRPWPLEGRRVEVMDVSDEVPTMDVGLVWATDSDLSESTRALIEFMHLSMGAGQPATPQ